MEHCTQLFALFNHFLCQLSYHKNLFCIPSASPEPCLLFVDLEKAYDKVCREELWEALWRYSVHVCGLLRVIKSMHQASEACVRVDGEVSEWFKVKQGVRQCCPLSPCMAIQYLSRLVVREALTNFQEGVHEVRHMPSVGSTICRQHRLGHKKGGGPATQHQGTANSTEGTQAGSN